MTTAVFGPQRSGDAGVFGHQYFVSDDGDPLPSLGVVRAAVFGPQRSGDGAVFGYQYFVSTTPSTEAPLASTGVVRPAPKPNRTRRFVDQEDEEIVHILIALITSGALE